MGWDRLSESLAVESPDGDITLDALAHKRGMVAFECISPDGRPFPDHASRRKVEAQVTKAHHEHLIVFSDPAGSTQIWQWVRREPGKPIASREHPLTKGQSGDALIQKLQSIAFTLDEEEELSIVDVARGARRGFDVERVTKRFYDQFQKEHTAFIAFIEGISDVADHEWYASVMLNRMMFVYFVQRKGFLDGDTDYLRNRLERCQREQGRDEFYSFYRYFLLRLFHEGLGGRERTAELEALLGRIPYLNGGLFEKHEIEKRYPDIKIPDDAFERIFTYFDQYQWHLDERPLRADNEINPDVLGYIFEKYVNQKQMGAYYTKEDITEYISKSTVIPTLLDAAKSDCRIAFENPAGPTVWDLLSEDPDRYIYPAARHGANHRLPPEIESGLDATNPKLLERRASWNEPASDTLALPTETWREVVARRSRYQEVRAMLSAGDVTDANDLVTLNLDLRQFSQDVIRGCEGPDLLRAMWHAIDSITILDPTCGSGAFLFAAMNILEPLYEACLDRMEVFIADAARLPVESAPEAYPDFRELLERVESHRNRTFFVFKSIMLNNLFGVDIMEEAIEICKLRLFLKLAAQVDPDTTHSNLGIEPLPDIDFNIRCGNTLVGFASLEAVQRAVESKLDLDSAMTEIKQKALLVQQAMDSFRASQIGAPSRGGTAPAKADLLSQLDTLDNELDRYLADEYGVGRGDESAFATWRSRHRPFHWFVEFFEISANGGFDVVIGNPPYLETRQIDYTTIGLASAETSAVHAMCIERSLELLRPGGSMSMIVPLALTSTQRMQMVQGLLENHAGVWYSNFAWRPAKLFDTVNRALTIFVLRPAQLSKVWATNYQKWTAADREGLFERMRYEQVPSVRPAFWVPKIGLPLERILLDKLLASGTTVAHFTAKSAHRVYYRSTGGLYWKVFTDFPPAFKLNGSPGESSRQVAFTVESQECALATIAALSSDLFWWWYTITSNLRDLNPSDIRSFPFPQNAANDRSLQELGREYLDDITAKSTMLVREQRQTGRTETQSFKIQQSKPTINKIDVVLAKHYALSEEEVEFVMNYDVKYRIGGTASEDN